ncbi:MAG: hypothetical protein V1755_15910 [Chloroflexota bacterium]
MSALLLVMLAACVPAAVQTPVPLTIHASSAVYPWLSTAYDCSPTSAAIVLVNGPEADMVLRLTEPQELTLPAYQIGTDELLVITHPQVGVGALAPEQVEALFAGQFANWSAVGGADLPVQVWAFATTVDIQEYFDRMVLHGRPVSSLARLAVSSQHMSDSVGDVPGSIGLLPRRWKAGNTREALSVSSVPVLALVQQVPQGALAELLGCMQARR